MTHKEAPKNCKACPRLVDYRQENKRAHPDWFNGAVASFGDEQAEILIVGLAPGVTGANRTGRPFTGDWAGDLLYATLAKFNLSNNAYRQRSDDGLVLNNCLITNAVRCVPPQNKPISAEINQCRPFLAARIEAMLRLKTIITLGKIAHDSTLRALGETPSHYAFGHGKHYQIRGLNIISSYHCSRYNTNTGRLTAQMFEDVFAEALTSLRSR